MDIVDPAATFEAAKAAADAARDVLIKEREKLKAEDKARREELQTKLATIDKLLRVRAKTTRAPKGATVAEYHAAKKASA